MVLRTKLYAPRIRAGAVIRQRLLDKLATPASGGLTLLQAPAGHGKTTLLRQWLGDQQLPYAWLSLDAQENDAGRFWSYVIAALQTVQPRLGQRALQRLQTSADGAITDVVTELINDLSDGGAGDSAVSLVLVMDDFHVISQPAVCASVSWFLDNLPASLHVAITSRSLPDLAIPRRRVRNSVIEIDAQQLNFRPDEIQQFFSATLHCPISHEASLALQKKTAGWVAGLQLAALAWQGQDARLGGQPGALSLPDFAGSHRFVVRYLEQEVLAMMPAEIQRFLLQVSVLPRFSVPLCTALQLPGGPDSCAKLLRQLEQQNLFLIPLDDRGEWFRFHHFFADALADIARAECPQQLVETHRQAAIWFENHQQLEDALHHVIAIQDWEKAATLIEQLGFDRMLAGHNENLAWWLQQLPDTVLHARPRLCLIKAWGMFATPQVLEAEAYLTIAEQQLAHYPDQQQELLRHIAIFRMQLARIQGDNALADQYSQQAFGQSASAYQQLPSAAQLALGLDAYSTGDLLTAVRLLQSALTQAKTEANCFSVLAISMVLSQTYFQQGFAQKGLAQCDTDRQWLLQHRQDAQFVDCWQNLVRVEILRELERTDAAYAGMQMLRDYANNGAPPQHVSSIALIEVSFLALEGRFADIDPLLDHVQTILEKDTSQYAHFSPDVDAVKAKYAIRTGRFDQAAAWASSPRKHHRNSTPYNLQQEDAWRARVLAHQGHTDAALMLLANAKEQAAQGGCRINVLRCMIHETLVRDQAGQRDQALALLRDGLRLAGDSFRRLFVDEGDAILDLFAALTAQGFIGWWSQRAVVQSSASRPPRCAPAPGLYEALTARETEILQLVAAGLSNQDIADHLSIALATTKAHLRNLFEKLAVKRRTHAIARARELGLISRDG